MPPLPFCAAPTMSMLPLHFRRVIFQEDVSKTTAETIATYEEDDAEVTSVTTELQEVAVSLESNAEEAVATASETTSNADGASVDVAEEEAVAAPVEEEEAAAARLDDGGADEETSLAALEPVEV